MAKVTVEQFAQRLRKFQQGLGGAVGEGLKDGMFAALKISVTEFFQGSPEPPGRSAIVNPPNPPPGPLKIRTGDLRRGIQIVTPTPAGRGTWVSGLETKGIAYGRIHELGGVAGAGHRSRIPARPYLEPAISKASESGLIQALVDEEVISLANRIIG